MPEKLAVAAFVLLLAALAAYLLIAQPRRARNAMATLAAEGFVARDASDSESVADIRALLPLPNNRIFIASEKTQGPFTLDAVWKSAAAAPTYFATLTRWQRSSEFTAEQGADQNERLAQTCYVEHVSRPGQPTVFVGYEVQSRGVVSLETYHGVTDISSHFDVAFARTFSVFMPVGADVHDPAAASRALAPALQQALLAHAAYIGSAPYASFRFSERGWGFCRSRVTDSESLQAFKSVCADIARAAR